jgi:hypothetical protein
MGLLGPSRDEILQRIAINTNGEFKKGKMFKSSCIKYTHEYWCYYLDDYSIQAGNVPIIYTRLRAPFINKKGFDLTIYKKTIFSNIAKTLGGQDIATGDPDFDEEWIVKGSSEELVKSILNYGNIRELIKNEEKLKIEIKRVEGKDNKVNQSTESQITFLVQDYMKDEDRTINLIRLIESLLDAFLVNGITVNESPCSIYE